MGTSPGFVYRSHFRRTVFHNHASCGTSRAMRLFTGNPASDLRLATVSGADSRQTFRVCEAARKLDAESGTHRHRSARAGPPPLGNRTHPRLAQSLPTAHHTLWTARRHPRSVRRSRLLV
jgi:hypothetical protein